MILMQFWDVIGACAGLLTSIGFVPQIYKIYRTKLVGDLSIIMLLQMSLGTFFWMLYSFHIQDPPMIGTNVVSFSCLMVVTGLFFKYRKVERQQPILLASSIVPAFGVEKYIQNEDYSIRERAADSPETAGKLNLAVYGSTGGRPPSGNDCETQSCKDIRTITATAGEILEFLSKSESMEIQLIGKLSSSGYKCMTIYGRTEDFPHLDEAIRHLDSSGIIDLKHWERVGTDSVFLVYGPGDSITTL
jgi:MtN3 and saliva related transmembrane protein